MSGATPSFTARSHSGTLGAADVGRQVELAGWVDALRDHGEVLFIHLRDRSGIVQAVFRPDHTPAEVCARAGTLRAEFCVALRGQVVRREPQTENPSLATGQIEVLASELDILARSEGLPFAVSEKAMLAGAPAREAEAVAEDLRLQYRYLDLRRPSMQQLLLQRHRIVRAVRDFLDSRDFTEIETPVLTRSTPEGARDYLVPSRLHPGSFYALPQSPQQFKQLLMVAGMERYYQIVRCFRDEDPRPNRQPEFTQIDLEASFIDEEFIYELVEELAVRMFAVGGISLPRPFPRMSWQEAMESTGSDRPDLRFGLRFVEATDIFRDTGYGIFKQILAGGGAIKGMNVKGASEALSKNVLQNEYAKQIVPGFGAKGMTWMRVLDGRLESNIVQFFSPAEQRAVIERFGAEHGDVILMIADVSRQVVNSALGQLRLHLAGRLGLIREGEFRPVWVTDFPLFEATEEGISSSHHPFTCPDRSDFDPADREQLLALRSRAYDLVINGEEMGGGSIRINDRELQHRVFRALGLSETEVRDKFGYFLHALDFGAPPHGGLALGLDRAVSMILGAPSIREVIAFPKNRSAFCPLTQAPAPVGREQLVELNLHVPLVALPGSGREADPVESLSWVSRIGLAEGERAAAQAAVEEAVALAAKLSARAGSEEPAFGASSPAARTREGRTPRVCELAEKGELLKNAPAKKDGFFKVASVLD